MKMHCRLLAICLLGTASAAIAGEKMDVERVLSTAREENLVMEHLDYLSNRIGPRLTSSDGLQNACEWTRDRFKSFGIENARLEQWGEFPVGFNRGPWSGRMIEPTAKPLIFGTNSWTAGTKGLVRGPVVVAPTNDEELEKVKDKLPGAWVLSPAGGARALVSGAEFRKKLEDAYAAAKVAGVVRPTRNELIVTSGRSAITWDKLPTVPEINLLKEQFDEIAALIKDSKPVVLEFDVRNYFKKGPIPLYNVIADIPGTELPDEYVIVGGHIDSWDGATGTTDNGTGCATTLEAARLLMKSGVKPRRTIRFMLWSGEEQGLLGSKAYVKAHPELMEKISAVLVHDGGTNFLSGISVTKAMKKDMDEIFTFATGLDEKMPFVVNEVAGIRRGVGSDHDTFLGAGVPGFFWNQRGGKANYTHTHHTQFDTYDAAIPEYQKHSSIIAALGALGIANLDHKVSREAMTAPGGGGAGGRSPMGMRMGDDLKVTEVTEDGAAAKAGVKVGDVIVKIGDKAVSSREDMFAAFQGITGNERTLTVKRDGKDVELKMTLPARPAQ